jgi:WD40 repeat protein
MIVAMKSSLLALLLLATPALAEPRVDAHGDPLPEGAIARFGTIRYRIGSTRTLSAWALSPDGKSLAALDASGITIWSLDTGQPLRAFARRTSTPSTGLSELCFSPDSKLVVRSTGQEIEAYEAATGHLRKVDDGKDYLIGRLPENGRLIVLHAKDGPLVIGKDPVRQVSASKRFFVVAADSRLEIVDSRTGKANCRLEDVRADAFPDLVFSPDDRRLYEPRVDGSLACFDTTTGKKLETFPAPAGFEMSQRRLHLALSTDGSRAFIAQEGRPIRQYDLMNRRWLEPLPTSVGEPIHCLPDGRRILQVGSDGVLHIFDVTTRKQVTPEGFEDGLFTLPSPDGQRVLAIHENVEGRHLDLFDLEGRRLWTVHLDEWPTRQWSPDGKHIALATRGMLEIRSAATGQIERAIHSAAQHEEFLSAIFSPDGRQLHAVINFGRVVATYDLQTGNRLASATTGGKAANDGAGDGRTLVIDSEEHGYALFDLDSRRLRTNWLVRSQEERENAVGRAAIAPDGSTVLFWENGSKRTSGRGGGLHAVFRDAGTLEFRQSLAIGSAECPEYAISPNSQWIATADNSGQVQLWDVATGDKLGTWSGHKDYVTSLHFVGLSKLLSSSGDLTALLWDLRPKEKPTKPRWDALTGGSREAYQAIWALADDPKAPDLLRTKLAAIQVPDETNVKRWLAELDAGRYAVREVATRELALRGRLIEPELREARAQATSEEVRTRLDGLLAKVSRQRTDLEIVQSRAVAALEVAGTDTAKELLREWARGARGAWLTMDARAALGRLGVAEP